MKPEPFAPLPHTADRALRITGESLPELFRNAARGLLDLMADPARVRPLKARPVELDEHDPEALLVAWLQEPIFLLDAEDFLCADARVDELSPTRLRGAFLGEPLDAGRHRLRAGVKAVTWQHLQIRARPDGGFVVDVVFDV
jgi:SHS2 domain-containing protein